MVQTRADELTLEAFLRLPETKPASEYIDGKIIQKPMPQGKHSQLRTELTQAINAVLNPQNIAFAFPELRCTFGGRSTVSDIAVFTWNRIPREDNGEIANTFLLAPDWTIEILSPDQNHTKVTKNILHCLKHGTQMGWLVDPAEKTVFAYPRDREIEVMDGPDTMLVVPAFANELKLTVQSLFAWLQL